MKLILCLQSISKNNKPDFTKVVEYESYNHWQFLDQVTESLWSHQDSTLNCTDLTEHLNTVILCVRYTVHQTGTHLMPNTQKCFRRQSVYQLTFLLPAKTRKEFWLPYTKPLLTLYEQVLLCVLLISFPWKLEMVCRCLFCARVAQLNKLFCSADDTCRCIALYLKHLLSYSQIQSDTVTCYAI